MKTRSSISSNQGWLVPAILIFGLIWTAVLALARITIHSPELTWLGAAGALSSAVLIAVVERQQARLRNLAETDPLTGLTNHRGFHEVLGRELAGARRAGTSLALVSLDLDDFKTVNDTHGHPYGDGVLRQVGAELRGAVRGSDTAARVGGEEFALILPETSGEMAREIAERARDAISRVPALGPQLSCSAGIAIYPVDADDAATLIELADGSLYWAK